MIDCTYSLNYTNSTTKLFSDFSNNSILQILTTFYFTSGKFPQSLKVAIPLLSSQYLLVIANYCCHNFYCFHN